LDKLVAIVGPTAVGKTKIAIEIAKKLDAQIISCDSMQVYRGMNIGTAKASPAEQQEVTHHLIDIVDPDEEYSVAEYQNQAKQIISSLNQKNCLPLLVGGTGLYYQAVVDDYTFYPMKSCQDIRNQWQAIVQEKGLKYAYNYLQSIDPRYAAAISSHDQKRIIRAIEVYQLTGKPFSTFQEKNSNSYNLVTFGFYLEREELYHRINLRVEKMLADGLIDEVKSLRDKGYDLEHKAMQGLGYKQVLYYLDGFLSKNEMINEIKKETRRYAKRQLTWFKKDHRIEWLHVGGYINEVFIKEILARIEGRLSVM
jgi:tRNA dimethylallyltransferase